MGHDCEPVAPSKTPSRPGDRVRTDRRDAVLLARLHRAGELTPVWVPDEGHEAMRDLVRARTAAMENLRRARQQLSGFLLRHDRVFRAGCNWTKKHRVWLSGLRFQHPAHQIVLQEYIHAVDDAAARLARIEDQIRTLIPVGARHHPPRSPMYSSGDSLWRGAVARLRVGRLAARVEERCVTAVGAAGLHA